MALFRLPEHGSVFIMCSLSWQTYKLLDSKRPRLPDTITPRAFQKSDCSWIQKNERNFLHFIKAISQQILLPILLNTRVKTTWQINSETFKEQYVSSHSSCEAGLGVNRLWSHPSAEGIFCFGTTQGHITYISQGKACLCFVIIGQVFLFSFLCNFITIPTTIHAGFNKEELTHFSELQNGICRTSQRHRSH